MAKRAQDGWNIAREEPLMLSCQAGYAPRCLEAARAYRLRGAQTEAETAARFGCQLRDAVSCRVSGLLHCKTAPGQAITDLAQACEQGDDPSCGTLRTFVSDERYRALVPNRGRTKQAWLGAAMDASSRGERELCAKLLEGNPESAALVRAAWAIDDGSADEIARRLEQLDRTAIRNTPEVSILHAVGRARIRHEPLWDALATAWKGAGAPDLRGSEVLGTYGSLGEDRLYPCVPAPVPDSSGIEDDLAVTDDAPLARRLLAYANLGAESVPSEFASRAEEARRRLRNSVVPLLGKDLFITIWFLGTEGRNAEPLSAEQLEWLERASALPWAPPKRAILELAATPHMDTVVEAVLPPGYENPLGRLWLTEQRTPSESKRIGALMTRIGERLLDGGWILDHMVGASWIRMASVVTASPALRARADKLTRRGWSLIGESSPWTAFGRWPLASLEAETLAALDTGEVEFLAHLVDLAGGKVEPVP